MFHAKLELLKLMILVTEKLNRYESNEKLNYNVLKFMNQFKV